ncbi:hypothetical protein EV188_104416 [Actinomycetospora succinea]|uniref:Uncharacterized protein n=1 Tax=Actinomycetospora succinea TaxID=663603 RepID=A0A4R6VJH9_9PSEU|nr:hypothetical protein [Actinomycetospora succinea]TDQ58669.1 hypothetical protein EV188_104416 [Actinomycetospora succinea]
MAHAAGGPLGQGETPTVRIARGERRSTMLWQVLSAVALLAMGGIHLYLAMWGGTGGLLGNLFILNALGGLVLAIAVVITRGQLLVISTVLGLLFLAGTLAALVLALTVGLFGIESSLDYELAPTTLVVETVGTIVLLITTAMVLRRR